jgi:hypothetical protein
MKNLKANSISIIGLSSLLIANEVYGQECYCVSSCSPKIKESPQKYIELCGNATAIDCAGGAYTGCIESLNTSNTSGGIVIQKPPTGWDFISAD